jgi:hypothetical protein
VPQRQADAQALFYGALGRGRVQPQIDGPLQFGLDLGRNLGGVMRAGFLAEGSRRALGLHLTGDTRHRIAVHTEHLRHLGCTGELGPDEPGSDQALILDIPRGPRIQHGATQEQPILPALGIMQQPQSPTKEVA